MMQPPPDPRQDAVPAEEGSSQPTQSTQLEQSQHPDNIGDTHLWGYLLPCNPHLFRVDFHRGKPSYSIGRNRGTGDKVNEILFPGMKISNYHCTISWDGREDRNAAVMVHDSSSNGTFINGEKIGKGRSALLHEGNEIAFGTPNPQPGNGGLEDYRFIYRHLAGGPPQGLYAHYQLHEELGKGSFATVMKAMCRDNGMWYAIKIIQSKKLLWDAKGNLTNDHADKPKYGREINILQTLRHPNICQMKEVFFEKSTVNLVLEYVAGGDLLEHILKKHHLSEPECKYITYQICDALAYIHGKGIAHRDLKPENVLLTKDNPPIVKVADFGLAKAIDSGTMLRTMCGTPCYLAPEVVLQQNNQGYLPVVDSWSVGAIVFAMLTGNSAFNETGDADIHTRVQTRVIDWASLDDMKVSNEAKHFIRRLLEFDPKVRMTLKEACSHVWLAAERRKARRKARGKAHGKARRKAPQAGPSSQSQPSQPSEADDSDIMIVEQDAAPMDVDAEPMDVDVAPVEDEGDVPDEENEDDVVPVMDMMLVPSQPMPGAYPLSQNPPRRRAQVISQSQDQSRDLLDGMDDEDMQPPAETLKRKSRALDFEASLTPMDEDQDEEDEKPGPSTSKKLRSGADRGAVASRRSKGRAQTTLASPSKRKTAKVEAGMGALEIDSGVRRSGRLQAGLRKGARRG